MHVLLLSILARCGVFTHVRDLAFYLQKIGVQPVIGFIRDEKPALSHKQDDTSALLAALGEIPNFIFSSQASIMKKVENMHIDIVHAHSPRVLHIAAALSQQLRVPYVITLHGLLEWEIKYPDELLCADCIIAVGPEVAKSAGLTFQHKIQIIYNGIDIDHFCPAKTASLKGPLRLVWMGRTSGQAVKSVECLSEAVGILRQNRFPVVAQALGTTGGAHIRHLESCGWIFDPLPYLQRAHLAFGCGRALREAMACGNVGFLLGSGYGGIVEESWFVQDRYRQLSGSQKHGAMEPDSKKITEDIRAFHLDRELLVSKKYAARKIAEQYFDIRQMVKKTCDIYHRL